MNMQLMKLYGMMIICGLTFIVFAGLRAHQKKHVVISEGFNKFILNHLYKGNPSVSSIFFH